MASEKAIEGHFGASVHPPSTPRIHVIHETASMDTLAQTPSNCLTPGGEYDPTSSHPCSPFYSHNAAATRTSVDHLKPTLTTGMNSSYPDLEAGHSSQSLYSGEHPNNIVITPSKDCSQWPGKAALGKRKKELKRERVCMPFKSLNRKQRIWAKIIVAIIIVGAATGIGIGVSKATGAGIWKNDNQTTQIVGTTGS